MGQETQTKPSYKILVVEDNPETLKLTKFILEDGGHTVFTATNAGETLNILDTACPESKACYDYTCKSGKCFDAVLIDYDLPDIKGGTLGGWIRTKFKDVALLIFTGYGRLPAIVKKTNEIGAELLTKPLDGEELLAAVSTQIDKQNFNRASNDSTESVCSNPVSTLSVRHILSMGISARAEAKRI